MNMDPSPNKQKYLFLQNCPTTEPHKSTLKRKLEDNNLIIVNDDNNPCWLIIKHIKPEQSYIHHLKTISRNDAENRILNTNAVYNIFYFEIEKEIEKEKFKKYVFWININIDYYISTDLQKQFAKEYNIIMVLIGKCIRHIKNFLTKLSKNKVLNDKNKDKVLNDSVDSIYFIGNFGKSIVYEKIETTHHNGGTLYNIEKIKTTEGNKRYSMIDMYGDPYPDYPNISNNISNSKSNDTKYPEKKNSDCILKLVNINFNLF